MEVHTHSPGAKGRQDSKRKSADSPRTKIQLYHPLHVYVMMSTRSGTTSRSIPRPLEGKLAIVTGASRGGCLFPHDSGLWSKQLRLNQRNPRYRRSDCNQSSLERLFSCPELHLRCIHDNYANPRHDPSLNLRHPGAPHSSRHERP